MAKLSLRRISTKTLTLLWAWFFIVTTLSAPMSAKVAAASASVSQATPKISFTFDDGLASTYTAAEPTLAAYGLTGTDYVITGCVGMTKVPNTCNANNDVAYMTWAQVQGLQADGWEIGSHTVDHDCLADSAETDPDDCVNLTPLTDAQLTTELQGSQQALAAEGINATDFSVPYGDYNNNVLAYAAKYYQSFRQFKNTSDNANVWPYSDYFLQDLTAEEGVTTVATIEADINNAITNNQWLILTFHSIVTKPSKNIDNWQFGKSELAQIAAYVQTKQNAGLIQSVHVDQALVTSSTNMLPDSNFSAGITDGWSTDAPNTITADSGNNGSYPNPTYSIHATTGATSTTGHLFSPQFAVNPNTTYAVKSFLNLESITSGEIGYYIDEYNANGQWISGQWKTQEVNPFVEEMSYAYKPSSSAVASASLQFIVQGAGINAYIANPQVFPVSSTAPTNLMPNGNFAAGISGGWTTDNSSSIYADSNNNGAPDNPTYSASLNATTTSSNTHLFSPEISVSPSTTYNITNWVDIKNINSGCIGFYIDEYNANGQWISGQYKFSDTTVGAQNVGFTYTPSSANVAKASLQVIVVGGSGINAYLDDVEWY